jgi:glc operon protein GlcG
VAWIPPEWWGRLRSQRMEQKALSLGVAKKLAAAAEEEAVKNKRTVVIAIVDDGGNLIYRQ